MRSEWTEEKDQSTSGIFSRGIFQDHLPSNTQGTGPASLEKEYKEEDALWYVYIL